jgi:hypothetical protein
LRGHEAGDCAAEGGFEIEDCGERGAEVFDAADEVAGVDVVLWGELAAVERGERRR